MKIKHTDYTLKKIYIQETLGFKLSKYTGNHEIFEIPDSVIGIGGGAFANHTTLREVRFPPHLLNIGESAFSGCPNLESVYLPDQIMEIRKNTFENCSNLTFVRLPRNLQVINHGAFFNCTRLKSILIPNQVKLIYGMKNQCRLIYRSSVSSSGNGSCAAASGCGSLDRRTYTKSKQIFQASAFQNCEQLTELYFCGDPPCLEGELLLNASATIYCLKHLLKPFQKLFPQYHCKPMDKNQAPVHI